MDSDTPFNYETDRPVGVAFDTDKVRVTLADGRKLTTPLKSHPWLESAMPAQREKFELNPFDVWWPDLDDGLDIEWLLQRQKVGTTSLTFPNLIEIDKRAPSPSTSISRDITFAVIQIEGSRLKVRVNSTANTSSDDIPVRTVSG
jgi:hypothetical protein